MCYDRVCDRNCPVTTAEANRMDPMVERLVSYAERNGSMQAEIEYSYRQRREAEEKASTLRREVADLKVELESKQNTLVYIRENYRDVSNELEKLKKKLAPKKAVKQIAKKAKK